jgi:hypothetical protein
MHSVNNLFDFLFHFIQFLDYLWIYPRINLIINLNEIYNQAFAAILIWRKKWSD